ncbi:hypothetical protein B296_00028671 [Ensete ventricosum]|uniref:Uncharacterized protein n=1 Tax=Ensete ventricosum TaxID=4639 RepID=A0A427AMC1_ENSVE|nr:hypothetical protein B296_00028671 [Ensete ventricosum]
MEWLLLRGGGARVPLGRSEGLLDGEGVDLLHLLRQCRVHKAVPLQQPLALELGRMGDDSELGFGGRLLESWSSGREEIPQLRLAADSCTKVGSGLRLHCCEELGTAGPPVAVGSSRDDLPSQQQSRGPRVRADHVRPGEDKTPHLTLTSFTCSGF